MKKYKLIADLCFWIHLFWAFLLVAGIPLAIIFPAYRLINAIIFALTIACQRLWGGCPLTILEGALRKKIDSRQGPYDSFISSLVAKWLGIKITRRQVGITTIVLAVISFFLLLI